MTELERQLLSVVEKRKAEIPIKNGSYNNSSKKQLSKIIETKIKTAFIAPLDYFESCFGILWGHGKAVSELSEEEAKFRTLWSELRNNVLNNGNAQIRAIQNELMQYTVTWERYKLDFVASHNPNDDSFKQGILTKKEKE